MKKINLYGVIGLLCGAAFGAEGVFAVDPEGAPAPATQETSVKALPQEVLIRVCPRQLAADQIEVLQGDRESSYGNNINYFSSVTVEQLQSAGLLPMDVQGVAGGSLLEFARDPKTTGKIIVGRGFTWSDIQKGKTKVTVSDAKMEGDKLACVYTYKRAYLGGDGSFKIYLVGKDRHAQ